MPKRNEELDKPFNDAMEHLNKMEGFPISKGGKLPQPIKIIGYFLFGGMILIILLGVFVTIFK